MFKGHNELKIEQNPSLVKLVKGFKFGSSSFNGDGVIQQSVRKGLERKNERTETPGQKQSVSIRNKQDIVDVLAPK